jgi:hypothetical protein
MTYISRGRSLTEVLIAVTLLCFVLGFVAVLCIGNFYRARRAMERQRQRRLAQLSSHGGNGVIGAESPKSTNSVTSSIHSDDQRQLMLGSDGRGGGMYPGEPRRRNVDDGDSLLNIYDGPSRANVLAV